MMHAWGITDIGLVRKENQDAYLIRCRLPAARPAWCATAWAALPAGRLASQIAAAVYLEELEKLRTADQTPEQLRSASAYAVSRANEAIQAAARENADYRNMGTTLVAAVSYEGGVVITNVGDSRAYHICENGITQITKDHSLVERMVDRGNITAEEARRHPNRNLITRALGPDADAQCDGYIRAVQPGEYVLLCTDGLVNTVTDQEMLFEVIHRGSPDSCLERLLEIAKSQGAPDNVTVVLMQKLEERG